MTTRSDLIKALLVTAELYQKPFSDAAARLLVEDLAGFRIEDTLAALATCRRELRYFPTVSEIVARIPGAALSPAHEAQLIAGRILKAITYMGPYKSLEAQHEIGPIGWEIVRMSGGWSSLCEMTDKDIAIQRSQWAKIGESLLMKRWTPASPERQIESKPTIQIKLPEFPKEPK